MIIAALSGTAFRKPFNDVLDLIPKAEKVKFLTAICKLCGHTAAFSKRKNDNNNSSCDKDRVELIGGGETYTPLCRECYWFKSQSDDDQKKTTC